MIVLLLFTSLIAYVIHFYIKVRQYPKGPFPLPFIGNMYQINPSKIHEGIARFAAKHGKLFTVWFMGKPVVFLCSYENMKEALVNNADVFINRTREPFVEVIECVENGGVAFSNGENYQVQKKAAVQILKELGVGKNVLEKMIHREIENFLADIDTNHDKNAMDFDTPIEVATGNIMNLLLFGFSYPYDKCEELINYTRGLMVLLLDVAQSVPLIIATVFPFLRRMYIYENLTIGKYKERFRKCNITIENNIQKVLLDYSADDEPTCFVQAYSQKMENNSHLDLVNLANICSDFFIPAVDAPCHLLRWSLLYFVKYPEIQNIIRYEIANVVGFCRLPSMNDRTKMPRTQAIMLEIQRHRNIFPANIQRETTRDITITGFHIPAKTAIMPQIYENLHDKDVYEYPKEFIIDRFLSEDGKSINQDLANKMLFFGAGKRSCTGEGLAKTELFLFTTAFIQKYHFTAPEDGIINMEPDFGLSFQTKKHFLRITPVDPKEFSK